MKQPLEQILNQAKGVLPGTNGLNGTDAASKYSNSACGGNGTVQPASSFKVLVVGAGIGGLTAAIALRQQGHEVLIFEQSKFNNELGAAIHLAPNSNGVLRRLGIFAEDFGANPMQALTEYTPEGECTRHIDLDGPNKMWQHPWLLAHRVHLHDALKKAATRPEGQGKPAELHTSNRVVDVDPEAATITLENGKTIQGDFVIGSDGVRSVTRKKVAGRDVNLFSSGKSAFRFMITRQSALDDPVTAKFAQSPGELIIWYGTDRRIVMYPTTNNTQLNFVCIHPDSESGAGGADTWSQKTSLEEMTKVYEGFDPAMIALISKADKDSLKAWKLMDMETLPTWVRGKLALLGDAAHPFTPHQGQGGGQAIEDAISMAIVFSGDAKKEEINERLNLYEKIRKERAETIQEYSRIAGSDIKAVGQNNMQTYTVYNFGHDEYDNSMQQLRKWFWARNPSMYWRMPIAFGPMPGPRQTHTGVVRQAEQSTFTTASIKFKTSRTVLQNLFPHTSNSYRFKSPGTVAYASYSQTTLGKMEWLGGSGYKHIGLYIHGVEYVKKDGSIISGTYMPLLFESLTDPIVSGREELGMPKLYTSVDIHRRSKGYRINTGWEGAIWGNFVWEGLEESDMAAESGKISGEDDDGILVHRYIPKVGRVHKGEAEAEYPVFVPYAEDFPTPKPQRVYKASKASFKIDPLDVDALPTLHHIISRLAEIPCYEVVSAKVVEGVGVPDVGAAHRVE
ncbi:FAD binding-containing protein [Coleophoma crateriformis]|uniref:FAD binding-containing protein n=1 Tax=Coleophoma crateriformis TaxID=565419 RepID=A0A3D8T8J2_9HELO|nr:FAD binding-containing protein [Coleophoma crateriformis]